MAACEEIGRRREPTACGWGLGLPLRVVRAGPVESLVRVPAKEVALRLHQCSSRQPRLAQRVVVREAAREGGGWDARLDRAHHGAPPSCLPHLQLVAEVLVEQDGVGGGLEAAERDAYLVEHGRADDAAPLPDARKLGQLDLPALGVRRRLDEGEALRVGAELARIESILEVVYETAAPLHQRPANHACSESAQPRHPVAHERQGPASEPHHRRESSAGGDGGAEVQAVGCALPCADEGGEVARVEGGGHGGGCDALLRRLLHRPLARALGATAVLDHVYQVGAWGERIFGSQDGGGDLDQVARKRAARPLRKHLRDLRVGEAAHRAEQVVRLANQLHVPVLNPIVHHLDVVASRARAQVAHAGPIVGARGDRLERGCHVGPRIGRATHHQARAGARTALAARDAAAHVVDAHLGHPHLPRLRQLEPLVPHVDHRIAPGQQPAEHLERRVDGFAGGHQQDHTPRRDERADECLHVGVGLKREIALALRTLGHLVRLLRGEVKACDPAAGVLGQVEAQRAAHHP
mmetsp:Transcript_4622/g.11867  ORF Transcript_4622/g.11867 Transcript_4622/m.11867 type:complete len:523 (+) Transcript_4622:184-1752(+)